jgi:hypothetical protein|tara:strand:- start:218 stop:475 length:258 start_codon:yes stop_codon:yes gene_type:complete
MQQCSNLVRMRLTLAGHPPCCAASVTKPEIVMAMSKEIAAQVAAQLTQAWAIRSGVKKPDPSKPIEEQVLTIYNRLLVAVQQLDR